MLYVLYWTDPDTYEEERGFETFNCSDTLNDRANNLIKSRPNIKMRAFECRSELKVKAVETVTKIKIGLS